MFTTAKRMSVVIAEMLLRSHVHPCFRVGRVRSEHPGCGREKVKAALTSDFPRVPNVRKSCSDSVRQSVSIWHSSSRIRLAVKPLKLSRHAGVVLRSVTFRCKCDEHLSSCDRAKRQHRGWTLRCNWSSSPSAASLAVLKVDQKSSSKWRATLIEFNFFDDARPAVTLRSTGIVFVLSQQASIPSKVFSSFAAPHNNA